MNPRWVVVLGLAAMGCLPLAAQSPPHHHHQPAPPAAADPAPPTPPAEHHHPSPPAAVADPVAPAPGWTLAELEARALAHHPAIRRAAALQAAIVGRLDQARRWPNPLLGYAIDERRLDGDPEGRYGFFFSQDLLLGGKLRRRRDVVQHELAIAQAEAEATQLALLTEVRSRFYRTAAAQQRLAVLTRLAQLAAEAVRVSVQLVNTGAADRPDLLAAQIEARLAKLEQEKAQHELTALWTELQTAVGDAAVGDAAVGDAAVGDAAVDDSAVGDTARRSLAVDLEADLPRFSGPPSAARADHPRLRAAQARIARAQAEIRRWEAEAAPDLELAGGLFENREEIVPGGRHLGKEATLELGVRLPLFDRKQGERTAAAADLRSREQELAELQLQLTAERTTAWAAHAAAAAEVASFRDGMLAAAEEAYRLYLERYQAMMAAYPQVLIAQRTWFQLQEAYLRALGELWVTAAELRGLGITGDSPGAV